MGGEADANPTVAWSTDYLAAVAAFSGGARNMTLNGARIPMFFPGTSLKIQNPGAQSPVGDKFEQSLLRYTAATLGLSYEQFSKDFSQVNYSGFRGALGETRRAMASRKKRVADGCANFGYRLWLEEAINENSLETLKRANIPAFYDGLNAEAYASADWIGAGEVLIDPLKETQADVLAIREGLMTKEQAIARRSGMDWRKVAEQQKRERELDESLGNPSIYNRPDTPQDNALSGSPQDVQA
jgi:lambda family phage portal protein